MIVSGNFGVVVTENLENEADMSANSLALVVRLGTRFFFSFFFFLFVFVFVFTFCVDHSVSLPSSAVAGLLQCVLTF